MELMIILVAMIMINRMTMRDDDDEENVDIFHQVFPLRCHCLLISTVAELSNFDPSSFSPSFF